MLASVKVVKITLILLNELGELKITNVVNVLCKMPCKGWKSMVSM